MAVAIATVHVSHFCSLDVLDVDDGLEHGLRGNSWPLVLSVVVHWCIRDPAGIKRDALRRLIHESREPFSCRGIKHMSDDEEAAKVAERLREKIRSNAEALLSKVDSVRSPRMSSNNLAGLDADAAAGDEAAAETTTAESSNDLAKRLQKLALERQKDSKDRLKVIQSDTSSHLSSVKTFQELNLPSHLLDAIFAMGFDRPSAIQEEALPRLLADPPRNLIGQAQSGSGKTVCFTLGMLFRIQVDDPPTCQALCVTPTRELAIQIVDKAVAPMAANMPGLKIQLGIAGSTIEKGSTLNAHLVVGTPGKTVDWIKRRQLNTKTLKVFCLDEADNMVAEGGHRYVFSDANVTDTFVFMNSIFSPAIAIFS